jgi:hypothetical protein
VVQEARHPLRPVGYVVERHGGRDVEQHAPGDERAQLVGAGARQPLDLLDDLAVLRPRDRADVGVRARGPDLHLELEQLAILEHPAVGHAHRGEHGRLRMVGVPALGRPAERLKRALARALGAGQEEVLLGAEQPEQVRVRDPRRPRDRLGRRAEVPRAGELGHRDLDDLPAPFVGREAGLGRRRRHTCRLV